MSEPVKDTDRAAPSISDAIEKIMANPEIISTVASALGNMNVSSRPARFEKAEDNTVANGEAGGGEAERQEDGAEPTHATPSGFNIGELVSSLSPILSRLDPSKSRSGDGHNSAEKNREALLCALKPYVSESRREAIDYIIRISQISDMLKHLN